MDKRYIALCIQLFAFICASCYRMPEDGEVSVVPTTNNPTIIRANPTGTMPTTPNMNF